MPKQWSLSYELLVSEAAHVLCTAQFLACVFQYPENDVHRKVKAKGNSGRKCNFAIECVEIQMLSNNF